MSAEGTGLNSIYILSVFVAVYLYLICVNKFNYNILREGGKRAKLKLSQSRYDTNITRLLREY